MRQPHDDVTPPILKRCVRLSMLINKRTKQHVKSINADGVLRIVSTTDSK